MALAHNPLLQRTRARELRWTRPVPLVWVKYELVRELEAHFRRACEYLGVPFEEKAIAYARRGVQGLLAIRRASPRHAADLVGFHGRWNRQHTRPRAGDPCARSARSPIWRPSATCGRRSTHSCGCPRRRGGAQSAGSLRYRIERKLLVALRRNIHTTAPGRAQAAALRARRRAARQRGSLDHQPVRTRCPRRQRAQRAATISFSPGERLTGRRARRRSSPR